MRVFFWSLVGFAKTARDARAQHENGEIKVCVAGTGECVTLKKRTPDAVSLLRRIRDHAQVCGNGFYIS